MRALLIALSLISVAAASPAPRFTAEPPPKLVVLVVFDQLRADYLSRFRDRFGPDGFKRFTERGAWFPYGEYQLMQSMTGPGHSVTLTGAWPARTGIPLNNWWSKADGAKVYCAQDPDTPVIGGNPGPHSGSSPRNLRAPTLGDALKNAGLPSKVVSVAIKDRAAILMAGHRPDGVYWMDKKAFTWVSSARYVTDGALPGWLRRHNQALASRRGETYTWAAKGAGNGLSDDHAEGFASTYILGADPRAVEAPLGYDLTLDVVEQAIGAHALGRDATPDLLAVSFSNFDMSGHRYGANHRRMEEMAVAADRALARLFAHLDATVGAGHYVVALTGDHGVAPAAPYADRVGLPNAPHMYESAELKADLEAALVAQLGRRADKQPWVAQARELNFWLNGGPEVHAAAAAWLRTRPFVAYAFTAADHAAGRLPPPPFRARINNQYVPGRSGDVVMMVRPYVVYSGRPASHLTGYTYDRLVPLAFTGAGVAPGVHADRAEIVDLAPTLAWRLGVLPPALSEGRVLPQVWRTP